MSPVEGLPWPSREHSPQRRLSGHSSTPDIKAVTTTAADAASAGVWGRCIDGQYSVDQRGVEGVQGNAHSRGAAPATSAALSSARHAALSPVLI